MAIGNRPLRACWGASQRGNSEGELMVGWLRVEGAATRAICGPLLPRPGKPKKQARGIRKTVQVAQNSVAKEKAMCAA
ncbi:hypothetical protein D3C77_763500 [compost metagenome]